MISQVQGAFAGHACHWLDNGIIRLAVSTDIGPRILWWGWNEGVNLFAEVPGEGVTTRTGRYQFLGGHRLWHAPEVKERTYWPDAWPVQVERHANGAIFKAPADGSGISKTIAVSLAPDTPEVIVSHVLRNEGLWPAQLAPWALSMCRLGGVALLPQPQPDEDGEGLLPSRQLVLWPYSDLRDPRLVLGNKLILVRGEAGTANKLGYANQHGWIASWLEGTLFSIHFTPQQGVALPDSGCNVECFIKDSFVELETLGPLIALQPGAQVTHDERWVLHPNVPEPSDEQTALALLGPLRLWEKTEPLPID